jgi:CelD/BcsL family acetyltransferase involved in cellulose biosynthesis
MTDATWQSFPATAIERRATDWDAIVASAGFPPFLRTDFVIPALREFGTGRERLVVYGSQASSSAMAIVSSRRMGIWETFQPSQLPLGAFVRDGRASLEGELHSLIRALPGLAVAIAFTQQDPDLVPRPPDTARLRTLDYIETARVPVEGTFDAYWAARGKNLRTNVKRQRAKLAQESLQATLDVVDAPERVAAAIADYGRLETAGWKAAGGTAVAAENPQGRFYTRVFETFCARGRGRIYRFVIGDKVAAMDLCIEDAGVVVVLKTAYDEAFGNLSPATLMRHEYFRTLFESGSVRRIEFYGKVMEWHRRWSDDVRTLYHVNAYRSPLARWAHERVRRGAARPHPASA